MTGRQLRDAGIADVLAADASITRDYARLISEAVDRWAGSPATFTSEDVRAVIEALHPGAEPHSPCVMGGAIKSLAAEGRLVQVGWREASRPEARARPLRVWRAT